MNEYDIAAAYIKERIAVSLGDFRPELAIILGSGLGGLADEVDIYMGTFSKSLASLGGYMASSAPVAEYVRHTSRPFIFSASIPPASCATALAALRHLRAHPEIVDRLAEITRYVHQGMLARGIRIRESNGVIPILSLIHI